MGILDQLLGNPATQQRQDYEDFYNRYQQGAPHEGYSDQEVFNRYQEMAPALNQQQYMDAAVGAAQRMSPQERAQFAQYLQQSAQQQNVQLPNYQHSAYAQDPNALGQLMGQMHQQQPNLLTQLMGGGGGTFDNPIAKAALAGVAAMAAKKIMS